MIFASSCWIGPLPLHRILFNLCWDLPVLLWTEKRLLQYHIEVVHWALAALSRIPREIQLRQISFHVHHIHFDLLLGLFVFASLANFTRDWAVVSLVAITLRIQRAVSKEVRVDIIVNNIVRGSWKVGYIYEVLWGDEVGIDVIFHI